MGLTKRFWSYVDKKGPNECWEWLGSESLNGYGQFWFRYKIYYAHRISWAIANKTWPIAAYKMICHKCDNKICVNPNHLYLGNAETNQQDASVLTPEDVREIRCFHKSGGYTYRALSKLFNVNERTISRIVNKITWKEV